jgi:hypothetical protein
MTYTDINIDSAMPLSQISQGIPRIPSSSDIDDDLFQTFFDGKTYSLDTPPYPRREDRIASHDGDAEQSTLRNGDSDSRNPKPRLKMTQANHGLKRNSDTLHGSATISEDYSDKAHVTKKLYCAMHKSVVPRLKHHDHHGHNSLPVAKEPVIREPVIREPVIREPVIKESVEKSTARGTSSSPSLDSDIEALQSALKRHDEAKGRSVIIAGLPNSKKGANKAKPTFFSSTNANSYYRSLSTSPAPKHIGSPSPNLSAAKQATERAKKQRKNLVHELGMSSPYSHKHS